MSLDVAPVADGIQGNVGGDAIEPGPRLGDDGEVGCGSPGVHEGVLGEIGRQSAADRCEREVGGRDE